MTETRDRILAATAALFARRGYHGTSLKEVTRSAGATIGSLYHFFPGGKAELAAAVLAESGAAYQDLFELIAADADDPVAAIGDFFDGAADTLAESDYADVCPIGSVAREVASTDDGLRLVADGVFRAWTAALAAHLERAGLAEAAAIELATTVIAALEGGFVLARTRRDADVVRTIGRHTQVLVGQELTAATAARVDRTRR